MIKAEIGKAGKHGGDHKSDRYQGNNVTLKRGNSPDYTIKRLKRDRPDLAEQVINGELTANAAAVIQFLFYSRHDLVIPAY